MTNPGSELHDWTLAQDANALAAVIDHARRASALAVDVEANGLFAYKPQLCTVQLAWHEGEHTKIAVIDTLRIDARELASLFAASQPIKVLHDLTFDARMLHESGVTLHHVRDTSVAARLLGMKSSGLAAVVATELGIVLDKRYQQHNWSRRPLEPAHLAYLSNDVAHLLDLDRALMEKVDALDIAAEVEAECAYKLAAAIAPSRDVRPMYTRVKGVHHLDRPGRAVLMHLVATREEIAETLDVPSFKVITNEILFEFAKRRPSSIDELSRIRGAMSGRAGRYAQRWLNAIKEGVADGDVPLTDRGYFEPPPFDRRAVARRRALESKLTAFRRSEAQRRGVDEQVVLPGHCVHDLAAMLASMTPCDSDLRPRIAAIAGLGAKRAEKYGDAIAALLEAPSNNDPEFVEENLDHEAAW